SLCQCSHHTAHPEVLGVHMQLVTVQLGQLGEGVLDVVQVLHSIPKGGEHFLAMGTDHGVAKDGGGAGEVPKGRKEPLGPGVDNQQPVGNRSTHLQFSIRAAPYIPMHGVGMASCAHPSAVSTALGAGLGAPHTVPNHSTPPCCEARDHNLGLLGPSSQHTSHVHVVSLSSSCQAWVLLVLSHQLSSSLLTSG
uniref:Uncharacterized protein n=1 Tax=Meleagris gallopavo TaxID=9103 RepID=A0A803YNB1_MELGA